MKEKALFKKFVSLLMTLILIFGTVNMAFAVNNIQYSPESDFVYVTTTLDEKVGDFDIGTEVAIITRYVGNGGDVVIPEKLGGCPVAAIGELAFSVFDENLEIDENSKAKDIESVIIPDTVVAIGNGAFIRLGTNNDFFNSFMQNLYGIKTGNAEIKVSVPSSVQHIGSAAFGCVTILEVNNTTVSDTPQQTIYYEGTEEKWNEICEKTDLEDIFRCEAENSSMTLVIDFDENLKFHHLCSCDGVTDNKIERVEPTCTTDGYTVYSCDCGITTSKKVLRTINHSDLNSDNLCDLCETEIYEENGYKYVVINDEATIVCYTGEGGHIVIPDMLGGYTVVKIDAWAFSVLDTYSQNGDISTAKKLESIVIPDSVKSIGMFAFLRTGAGKAILNTLLLKLYGKAEITVTVPSSVEYIGPYAFGCLFMDLKDAASDIPEQTVLFEGTQAQWDEICDKTDILADYGFSDAEIDLGDGQIMVSRYINKSNVHYSCDGLIDSEAERVEPTCTEDGYVVLPCGCEKQHKITSILPALGHTSDEGTITLDPTCTECGTKTYHCTVCGEQTGEENLPALGHTPDEGHITKEPTCTEIGFRTVFCESCNLALESSKILATGHKDENTDNYCDICDEKIDATIPDEEEPTVPDEPETTEATYELSTEGIAVPGQKITVYLSLKNNPGIISLRNFITFDENIFTLESVTDLGLVNGFVTPAPDKKSPYTLVWANGAAETDTTVNGQIAALTFTINEDAPIGDYEIYVTHQDAINTDLDGVMFESASASVSVIDVDKGDVNADGAIDLVDSAILARYLARWNVDVVSFAADIDEDGEVTDRDSILLNRYLAGWNVEELKQP